MEGAARTGRMLQRAHVRSTSVAAASTDAPEAISDVSAMFAMRAFVKFDADRMASAPAWLHARTRSRICVSSEEPLDGWRDAGFDAGSEGATSRPGGSIGCSVSFL